MLSEFSLRDERLWNRILDVDARGVRHIAYRGLMGERFFGAGSEPLDPVLKQLGERTAVWS